MKYVFFFCLLASFISCANKTIDLPKAERTKIIKVDDVSSAFLFYVNKDCTSFNRKNIIGTTNWLINVDKKLSLKAVFPHLNYLQNKRKKAQMHKKEGAKNYLTFHNTTQNKVDFLDITDINFNIKNDKNINLHKQAFIISDYKSINNTISTIKDLNSKTDEIFDISLNFSKQLDFQSYIEFKIKLEEINNDKLKIISEYIF